MATGAVLDNNEDRLAAQSLLDYWVTSFYRAGEEPPDTALALFDPELAPELDESLCPYRGLDAFREEDSRQFFGRQGLVQKLVERLRERRLLAVIGPSGCGKSSLVAAGLLPALKDGTLDGSQTWRYLRPIVPGSDPLASLAWALAPFGIEPPPAPDRHWILDLLKVPDPTDTSWHLKKLGPVPVVLVIDQFEELFTLCDDTPAREQFLKVLLRLATAPGPRHTVVLTMRLDYRERVTVDPDFFNEFEKGEVLVTPLTAGELREAIEKPAEAVGLKFEAGIVDRLVRDVLGEPAALPLLQFTLLKLWDLRERNLITWGTYVSLGNAREALARTAERFFQPLLPEEQEEVKRLLLRLVRPTVGWEVTSRRLRLEDLLQSANRLRAQSVLDKLIQARLVRLTRGESAADDQVEIAHEALVRNWPRLVEWLVAERSAIQHRLALTDAARIWQERGEDPSALLRGSLLEDALAYTDLNTLEAHFVQASQAAAEAAEREEFLRQQRELEQVLQLAEEHRLRAEQKIWANRRLRRQQRELEQALRLAEEHAPPRRAEDPG